MPSTRQGSSHGPPGHRTDRAAPDSPYSARLSVRHPGCVNLPEWVGKARAHGGGDAAAHVPHRNDAHLLWFERVDQVVQNAIGDVLVEVAFVAEAPQVELQAFELDDLRTRNVTDRKRREVGLARHRTDAGELGADALDLVVAMRVRVGDRDQLLRGLRWHRAASIRAIGGTRDAIKLLRKDGSVPVIAL